MIKRTSAAGAKTARFIFASGSPRRRGLLKKTPWRFVIIPSAYREPRPTPADGKRPRQWALLLAERKARDVAGKYPDAVVWGADTIVYRKGKIFGKPASRREAYKTLEVLSGRWHTVYTALAVVHGDLRLAHVAATQVRMKSLSPERLDFLSQRNHDKAGAYAAQGRGNPFIEEVRGDFDNVVGLPLRAVRLLAGKLRKRGIVPPRKRRAA